MCALSKGQGLNVRHEYSPDTQASNEYFDMIVFNDVLECIAHVDPDLEACARHLSSDGLQLINLSNTSGFFYKVSKIPNLMILSFLPLLRLFP